MTWRYKYDVAISVAEEDKAVADLIVAKFKERQIKCYYYDEKKADDWGKYILTIATTIYGKQSRYILLITSAIYVHKYWSNIEVQMSQAVNRSGDPHILQLRLDNTEVDGLPKHVVFLDWTGNPEQIAEGIKQKLKKQKFKWKLCAAFFSVTLLTATIFTILYLQRDLKVDPERIRIPQAAKVKIKGFATFSNNTGTETTSKSDGKDSFYISNLEITVAQFRVFCLSQKKTFPPQPLPYYENGPVRNVTWFEATEYCQWTGGRLPTETEWEFAAKGNVVSKYSGGNNASKVAVYNKQKAYLSGSKEPNAFGLYDMTGNVSEWCSNWYDSVHTYRPVRGGSYLSNIYELQIAHRSKEQPDNAQPDIGFRVVWDK
jgi:formylglycine-generating enzyme